jgi:hypothetical protein
MDDFTSIEWQGKSKVMKSKFLFLIPVLILIIDMKGGWYV